MFEILISQACSYFANIFWTPVIGEFIILNKSLQSIFYHEIASHFVPSTASLGVS
jgi:hypothetical protein